MRFPVSHTGEKKFYWGSEHSTTLGGRNALSLAFSRTMGSRFRAGALTL